MPDKIDMVYDLLKDVHSQQTKIMQEGCPTGTRIGDRIDGHEKRLQKVENLIAKAVIAGILVAGGGAGGGAVIAKIMQAIAEGQ